MKKGTKIRTSAILSMMASAIVGALTLSPLATHAADYQTTTVTYPYYAFIEDPEQPWSSVWDALDSTDTIEYSDEFFEEKSPGDHPELRAVSYALALAGYENKADGYPSISAETNPKLKNLLNQMGFSDYQSWDTSSEANGHSMGTTIAHKTTASGQDLIVVAPRNYNYMTEWLSNFNVGTSGDHAGFSESASLIVSRLNQYLSNHSYSNYKIWMVGYSRGGAVIDLAAKNINANLSSYSMRSDDFYVYTFGAPRASTTETKYQNIHDVKDGNDLLLGYVFPKKWGFYNTGVYEEIHPADLNIATSVIDLADLSDSSKVLNILINNTGVTQEINTTNGRAFMDDWMDFVNKNGLTREYFDAEVKPPLSAIMQAYQLRTLDKQSEFTNFIKNTDTGLLGRIAGNAFIDLMTGGYGATMEEAIANFPPYQEIIKILRGTATDADVDDLLAHLTDYMGDYADYSSPTITEEEFDIIKDNIPKLIKALSPLIIADARYTREHYGDSYSLYYTYTLVSNAETLVIGHIPESIMPILKSLIVPEKDDDDILVPDSGVMAQEKMDTIKASPFEAMTVVVAAVTILAILAKKKNML